MGRLATSRTSSRGLTRAFKIGLTPHAQTKRDVLLSSVHQSKDRKAEAQAARSKVRVKLPMRAPQDLETRLRKILLPHRVFRLTEDFQRLAGETDALENGTLTKPIGYDARKSSAYLAFRFLPAFGVVKAAVMRAIEAGFRLENKQQIKILDFGAGPGTASCAAYDAFGFAQNKAQVLEASLIEASLPMVDAAKRLSEGCFELQWCRNILELTRGTRIEDMPRYDMVLATYALSELPSSESRRLVVDVLWRSVAPNGLLLVLERGSPRGAEIVGDVREQILRGGSSEFDVDALARGRSSSLRTAAPSMPRDSYAPKVIAPCGHERECPMKNFARIGSSEKASKEFCYFVQDTDRLLKPTTSNDSSHRSSYSFVAVQKVSSETSVEEQLEMRQRKFRVLRKPRKNVRHVVLDLCVPDKGVEKYTVPHSTRLKYRIARQIQWGDLFAPAELKGQVTSVVCPETDGTASPAMPKKSKPRA